MRPAAASSRLGHLDGLRGLAALTVLFAHYVLAFQPAMYLGTLQNTAVTFAAAPRIAATPLVALFSPQFGVAIFFVLSGYVLAASVSRKPAPLPELALRRWVRLSFPVVVTTVPIWFWLTQHWHPDTALAARNHSGWLGMNFGWLAWEPNDLKVALFQAAFDVYARANHWWNTSLWTIQIELWGSLALFAAYEAMLRLGIGRPLRLLAGLAALALTWRGDYGGFAAGALLFEAQPVLLAPLARHTLLATLLGLPLLLLALLLGGAPYYATQWTPYWDIGASMAGWTPDPIHALHRAGAALLVAVALFWRPLQALLTTRACAFLGRVSFMVYLCHVFLICTWGSFLVLHLWPRVGYNAATVITLPLLLAAVLCVATLAERWVDRPGIALAHRAGRALTSALGRLGGSPSRAVRRA